MSIHFVEYPRTLNISAATPVEASRPYSDPPAKQIALMTSRCCPLIPGDPPRTSIARDAVFGKWNTVQPVGPSSYSAIPTSSPGKSNSSARALGKSVRGTSRSRSLVAGPLTRARARSRPDVPDDARTDRSRGTLERLQEAQLVHGERRDDPI